MPSYAGVLPVKQIQERALLSLRHVDQAVDAEPPGQAVQGVRQHEPVACGQQAFQRRRAPQRWFFLKDYLSGHSDLLRHENLFPRRRQP